MREAGVFVLADRPLNDVIQQTSYGRSRARGQYPMIDFVMRGSSRS